MNNQKNNFALEIGAKATRKMKARESNARVWFGLGMMGLVGWSVVVPTLIGTAIGIWLDDHHPGKQSWTLTLLIIGLAVGCANAWRWVRKEDQEIRDGGQDV